MPVTPDPAADDDDPCLCDGAPVPGEAVTDDESLPITEGGVATGAKP